MTQENLMISIDVLRKEVKVLTSRLRPNGTGYLHTTIDTINSRIDELIEEVTAPYWKDEDGDIGRLPGQTRESHLRSIEAATIFAEEDVYDGFAEHTEAMEQSRLRKIQDSAAGRSTDDVEHTKEYYDTERNKPYTEGLSNRSMKQKYGQAVMTVSEQMQEELEPLPINTFE